MKNLVRNLLLTLVAGSLLFLAGREVLDRRAAGKAPSTMEASAPLSPATRLVVYYFSQGKECSTCEQIPAFAREALDTYFAAELAAGVVVWRAIDVDEYRNEHYIDEYSLYTKAIVLSRMADGKQVGWDNLAQVWELVYDKPAFIDYLRKEIRKALETTP